ncbi:hypothetical protein FS837_000755 [Tulasnella sp. UAMH 9824]|nr:hypothetical protein FS837_000755 [Tulasnella sp. UAMH 9824]
MSFFFSSRSGNGAEQSRGESSGSMTAVLKSKWYSKTRNVPSPIKTSTQQSTTHPSTGPAPTTAFAPDLSRSTLLSPTFPNGRDPLASPAPSTSSKRLQKSTPNIAPSRPSSSKGDSMTATLAARLDELELSNSEGLLDDEGYRILRQNLLASFTSPGSASLPTEQPSVRISTHGLPISRGSQGVSPRPLQDSNFHVSSAKAESIRSGGSRSTVSAMKNALWRKPSRRRPSTSHETDSPVMDNASVFSGMSRGSSIQRVMASSKSSGSLGSEYSQSQQDLHSLSSKRTGLTGGSRATGRSARGPPSSYNLRRAMVEGTDDDDDDAHRQSSAELRTEIAQVEAEYKRIMDNYHGAEMATLAKLPNRVRPSASARPLSAVSQTTVKELSFAAVSSIPDSSSPINQEKTASHHVKSKSSQSKLSVSLGRFGSLRRKGSVSGSQTTPSSPALQPALSLSHKSSMMSLPTNGRPSFNKSSSNLMLPPGNMSIRSRPSNVSARDRPPSALGLAGMDESEDVDMEDEEEREARKAQKNLDRIQSSREDAVRRYENRLEYLRTKLKSAEIHERLLKK